MHDPFFPETPFGCWILINLHLLCLENIYAEMHHERRKWVQIHLIKYYIIIQHKWYDEHVGHRDAKNIYDIVLDPFFLDILKIECAIRRIKTSKLWTILSMLSLLFSAANIS